MGLLEYHSLGFAVHTSSTIQVLIQPWLCVCGCGEMMYVRVEKREVCRRTRERIAQKISVAVKKFNI
jgi:hypothetical protein